MFPSDHAGPRVRSGASILAQRLFWTSYIRIDILSIVKPIAWMGASKHDLKACAADIRRAAGRELERVQRGADPVDWKPMATIGRGAREIRVHVGGEVRVFYVATFSEAVYVLHVFAKQSQKTSRRDLALGKQRYQAMVKERRTKP
jgi:phage-related protein